MQVRSPAIRILVRVALEPGFFAGDEQRHAALDVDGAVVEGDAEPADVRVARREEPLARVWQLGVVTHEVEGVVREVVVHCFLAQLFADEEELCLSACWRAETLVGEVFEWDRVIFAGIHVPLFENVCEANVVVGGSRAPVDVHVAGTYEVVEYLVLELRG